MSIINAVNIVKQKVLALSAWLKALGLEDFGFEIIVALQILTIFLLLGFHLRHVCQVPFAGLQGEGILLRVSVCVSCIFIWPVILTIHFCGLLFEFLRGLCQKKKKPPPGSGEVTFKVKNLRFRELKSLFLSVLVLNCWSNLIDRHQNIARVSVENENFIPARNLMEQDDLNSVQNLSEILGENEEESVESTDENNVTVHNGVEPEGQNKVEKNTNEHTYNNNTNGMLGLGFKGASTTSLPNSENSPDGREDESSLDVGCSGKLKSSKSDIFLPSSMESWQNDSKYNFREENSKKDSFSCTDALKIEKKEEINENEMKEEEKKENIIAQNKLANLPAKNLESSPPLMLPKREK